MNNELNKLPPLPDDAIEVVRQAAEDESAACFVIGDTANALAEEMPYPKALIIARLAYETGLASDTIRDYAWVAGRVSVAARDTYPLTRHQWKACLSAGEDFLLVAEWAVNRHPDKSGGRPASVKAIRAYVLGGEAEQEAYTYFERWRNRTDKLLFDGGYDERLPVWMREMYRRWRDEFNRLTEAG